MSSIRKNLETSRGKADFVTSSLLALWDFPIRLNGDIWTGIHNIFNVYFFFLIKMILRKTIWYLCEISFYQ